MMIAFCMLFTPVMVFIREKSGSVIMAAIAHGTLNALAGISIMYLAGYKELIGGITGIAGFIVLAVADLVILLLRKNLKTTWNTRTESITARAKFYYLTVTREQGYRNSKTKSSRTRWTCYIRFVPCKTKTSRLGKKAQET